jgi:rubrerythrin
VKVEKLTVESIPGTVKRLKGPSMLPKPQPTRKRVRRIAPNAPRSFKCTMPTCDAAFTTSNRLHYHKTTHTKKPVYCCDLCDKTFPIRSEIKKHLFHHKGIKREKSTGPFKCTQPQCDASFQSENRLRYHITTHVKKPDYCCDLCGKAYKLKSKIEWHMAYHAEPKLPCPVCGKMKHHLYDLYTHIKKIHKDDVNAEGNTYWQSMRRHTIFRVRDPNAPRPFKCTEPTCDASFLSEAYLSLHKRTHVKKPHYCCDLCGKIYARRVQIELHMAYHTEPNVPCPICGKMLHHRYLVDPHIRKCHKDQVGNVKQGLSE